MTVKPETGRKSFLVGRVLKPTAPQSFAIYVITPYNVCAVLWGIGLSVLDFQYCGVSLSTAQYCGGYHDYCSIPTV